ncbi:MAG TPA: glycoside hydrolase, partial [Candidatus Binatia bacterium]|nr:glycoside hydrolase [Candidatus Binatia bacterium]
TAVLREMERSFRGSHYSLPSLFRDEQQRVLRAILAANLQEAESLYRQIYEPREPLMRFITALGLPLPKGFSAAAEFVLNQHLRATLEQLPLDEKRLLTLLESARLEGLTLDRATLEYAYRQSLEHSAEALAAEPSLAALEEFCEAAKALQHLPFEVDLWKVQNLFFQLLPGQREQQRTAGAGDETSRRWAAAFGELAKLLRVKVPAP